MASKVDQAFIDNLQNFCGSLENIVDILKEQSKKSDNSLNDMSSNMDGSKMEKITQDIKKILDISKRTDNRTKEILKEIRAAKRQKETGMFDKISNKENKSKITDGIKTIILIAGGVLAIGLAFKIIGKVDFVSVIALSVGILVVAKAFQMIGQIKDLTPKKAFIAGLVFIAMAGAIVVSSIIMRYVASITPMQMFSFLMVGTALGVGTYFLMKSISKLKIEAKDIPKILLLPLILPAIAAGIVLSSYLLSMTNQVSLMQALSAILVGVILAVGAISVAMIMKTMKGKSVKDVFLTMLIIPAIAGGIVLASIILQFFQPITQPFQLLFSALAIGLSLLMFVPVIMLLGKLSMNQMLIGALAIPVVSLAMVAASYILQFGDYNGNFPSLKWSFGVGMGILMFAIPTVLMGAMVVGSGGAGALGLLVGAAMTVVVAAAIAASSYILNEGVYGNYPSLSWAAGVGISMLAFSVSTMALGLMAMTGIGAVAILAGAALTLVIAQSIVSAAAILNNGVYGAYPSFEWAAGVGLSMLGFTASTLALGLLAVTGIGAIAILAGIELTKMVAQSIVDSAAILNNGVYGKYPSFGWGAGVGLSMLSFTASTLALGLLAVTGIGAVAILAGIELTKMVAQSIVDASAILNNGVYGVFPSLSWASGVGLSMLGFSTGVFLLGAAALTGIGYLAFEAGMSMIITLAEGIKQASITLAGGVYSGGPGIEWAMGVGMSISAFAQAANVAMQNGGDLDTKTFSSFMVSVAQGMIDVSVKLKEGDWTGGFPSEGWGRGVSASLTPFIDAYQAINERKSFLQSVFGGGGDNNSFSDMMVGIANAMVLVANVLKGGDFSGGPDETWASNISNSISAFTNSLQVLDEDKIDIIDNFADAIKNLAKNVTDLNMSGLEKLNMLTSSITILSVVDEKKLQQTLDTLDNNKSAIANTLNGVGNTSVQPVKQSVSSLDDFKSNSLNKGSDIEAKTVERLDNLIEKVEKILENMVESKNPVNVNSGGVIKG